MVMLKGVGPLGIQSGASPALGEGREGRPVPFAWTEDIPRLGLEPHAGDLKHRHRVPQVHEGGWEGAEVRVQEGVLG